MTNYSRLRGNIRTMADPCWGKEIKTLWYWVREREAIRVAKERNDVFLTKDAILRESRFRNVCREDDRVTKWIDEHICKPYENDQGLWLMLCAARQINWPDTLFELMESVEGWPQDDEFDPRFMAYVMNDRAERGLKVYTGVYTISAPQEKGADKPTYTACTVLGELWHHREVFRQWFASRSPTLQGTHEMLVRYEGWGNFTAYQAVVDMRFTALLRRARDRETWAAAGPGTIRGLNRVHDRPFRSPLSQAQALDEIADIYSRLFSETGVTVDFSDVPNILCEIDKYIRFRNGAGTPRTRYVLGRGY